MRNPPVGSPMRVLQVGETILKGDYYRSSSGKIEPAPVHGMPVLDNGVVWYRKKSEDNIEVLEVVWPYNDCTIFDFSDKVLYAKVDDQLFFYHPSEKVWKRSNRPNILEDTCSHQISSKKITRSELPMEDL